MEDCLAKLQGSELRLIGRLLLNIVLYFYIVWNCSKMKLVGLNIVSDYGGNPCCPLTNILFFSEIPLHYFTPDKWYKWEISLF